MLSTLLAPRLGIARQIATQHHLLNRFWAINAVHSKHHSTDLCSILGQKFNLTDHECKKVFTKCPEVSSIPVERLELLSTMFDNLSVDKEQLKDHCWGFLLNPVKLKSLEAKLDEHEFEKFPTWARLPVLSFPIKSILFHKSRVDHVDFLIDFNERIDFFVKELNVNHQFMLKLLDKHSYLFSRDFENIKANMKLLKSFQVKPENLLSDLWVFQHRNYSKKERLEYAKQVQIPIKCWMIRCNEETFDTTIGKWKRYKNILGDDTRADYISKRLGCSLEQILELSRRHKGLLSTSPPKLEELIDLLHSHGYSKEEIIKNPRVFSTSIKTLKTRISQLAELNRKQPLWVLTITKSIYDGKLKEYILETAK